MIINSEEEQVRGRALVMEKLQITNQAQYTNNLHVLLIRAHKLLN